MRSTAAGRHHRFEQLAALAKRRFAQIVAVQVEQVEDEVDHRRGARQVRHGVGIGVGDARLDQVEARDALVVEHRDFAIEHGLARRHVVRDHGQLGILPLAAQPAARLQPKILFAINEGDGAHAVPLHFEEPVFAARRPFGEGRQHGLDGVRHGGFPRAFEGGQRFGALAACPFDEDWRGLRRGAWRRAPAGSSTPGPARRRFCAWPCAPAGCGRSLPGCGRRARCRRGSPRPSRAMANCVALFDEQPLVAFAAALHEDQGEIAVQLLAVEAELQVAARQLALGVAVAQQLERAAVPQHHAARAVVAGGDGALEIAVFDGVVLHMRRQVIHRRVERGPLRNGPGFQHAVDFQPEIVMQPGGVVPLHTEGIGARPALP